jgi:hypothetical protein
MFTGTPACIAARAEERREGGTLVVRGAAAEVAVALLREGERLGVPRLRVLRGGLHVEVVVDRHRRAARVFAPAPVHDRRAGRVEDLGHAAETADRVGRELRAFLDRPLPRRVDRHRRDLDELFQQLLELCAALVGIVPERLATRRVLVHSERV